MTEREYLELLEESWFEFVAKKFAGRRWLAWHHVPPHLLEHLMDYWRSKGETHSDVLANPDIKWFEYVYHRKDWERED